MKLIYLGSDILDGEDMGQAWCIATPSVRDTSVIRYPALSLSDAGNAASLAARSHYPGPPSNIAVATRGFLGANASAVLLHVIEREHLVVGGERVVLAPHDFLTRSATGRRLAIFVTPGWVEWLECDSGLPIASGTIENARLKDTLPRLMGSLSGDIARLDVWTPLASEAEVRIAIGDSPWSQKPIRVTTFESQAAKTISGGLNSFGPKSNRRRIARTALFAILIAANLGLAGNLVARDLIQSTSQLEALRRDKISLEASAAEVVRLRRQIEDGRTERGAGMPANNAFLGLETLAESLPSEVLLSSIDIDGTAFRASGTTGNVFSVLAALGADHRIARVSLDQAVPDSGGLFRFSIAGSFADDK